MWLRVTRGGGRVHETFQGGTLAPGRANKLGSADVSRAMACGRWRGRVSGLLTALAGACASDHDLTTSPLIRVEQTPLGLAFVRGDERYEHGAFGGGLRRAVEGVPAAEEHAEASSMLVTGGLLLGLGSATLAGASIASAVQVDDGGDGLDTPLALASGAVMLSVVSSILYESGTTRARDAVNAYNDEVQRATSDKRGPEPAQPGEGTSMLQRRP